MIVSPQTRVEAAREALERAERRVRELRLEEQAALARGDYAAATSAVTIRALEEASYAQALAVVLRGGR